MFSTIITYKLYNKNYLVNLLRLRLLSFEHATRYSLVLGGLGGSSIIFLGVSGLLDKTGSSDDRRCGFTGVAILALRLLFDDKIFILG